MENLNLEIDKARHEIQGIRCKAKIILNLFLQDVVINFDEDETEGIIDQTEAILRRLNRLDEEINSWQVPPTREEIACLKQAVFTPPQEDPLMYGVHTNGFPLQVVK